MKRTLSLVLVLTMLFSAMLGVISFADNSESETYGVSANLEFADTIYLLIAVKCPAGVNSDDVKVKITNTELVDDPNYEPAILSRDTSVESGSGYPTGAFGFKYTDLAAKNMADELKIEVLVSGASKVSKTYSVLEYALRVENSADSGLIAISESMLKYAAAAQTAYGHTGTYDLEDDNGNFIDHSLVRLTGGAAFADGSKKAIMKAGDASLTATMSGATIWYDSALSVKAENSDSYTVSYSEKNVTIFATSASIISTGVDYTSSAIMNHTDILAQDHYFINTNSGYMNKGAYTEYDVWTTTTDIGSVVGNADNLLPATDLAYTNRLKWSHGADKSINGYINTNIIQNRGVIAAFNKENGYLQFISNATGAASAYRTNTTWGSYIGAIASDANAKAFTISFTLSMAEASGAFEYISIRSDARQDGNYYNDKGALIGNGGILTYSNAGKGANIYRDEAKTQKVEDPVPYGRIAFFRNTGAGLFSTYLTQNGNSSKSDANVIGNYIPADEFVTVHAVFVFETASEGMRIDYYINDNPNRVATLDIGFMQKSDFINGAWYLDTTLTTKNDFKIQSFLLSSGNVADNFK